jgi:anhydro-N-acetylmuramic acid kinase
MPEEVIVSGGGANNQTLMTMLRAKLAPAIVRLSEEVGIPGDAKEALAFAILAYETWHGRPGNLPAATGASRAVILGQITR